MIHHIAVYHLCKTGHYNDHVSYFSQRGKLQSEETLGWIGEDMRSQDFHFQEISVVPTQEYLHSLCAFADISLSLAMTYWKERSSEEKRYWGRSSFWL